MLKRKGESEDEKNESHRARHLECSLGKSQRKKINVNNFDQNIDNSKASSVASNCIAKREAGFNKAPSSQTMYNRNKLISLIPFAAKWRHISIDRC
jgi:hypothetical protein